MFLHTKNEIPRCSSSNVLVGTDRRTEQTDRQTDLNEIITSPHSTLKMNYDS